MEPIQSEKAWCGVLVATIWVLVACGTGEAQGFNGSVPPLYSGPFTTQSTGRSVPQGPASRNPFAGDPRAVGREMPQQRQGEEGTLYVSSASLKGILPEISNFRFGYIHSFGGIRQSLLHMTYMLPIPVRGQDMAFLEWHGRFESPLKIIGGSPDPSMQVLLGGGYRFRPVKEVMLGVNAFWNRTRQQTYWYSSGIIGAEVAFAGGGGILSMSWNAYSPMFSGTANVITSLRNGDVDWKLEAAYTHPCSFLGANLRLKAGAYQLDRGGKILGKNVGADLTAMDGRFSLRYEYGVDRISSSYHTVFAYWTWKLDFKQEWAGGVKFIRRAGEGFLRQL